MVYCAYRVPVHYKEDLNEQEKTIFFSHHGALLPPFP